MSTEKMREDFEKWECDSDQGPQTDPVWLMYDANTKSYPLDKIQSRWEVWQASRAAIEVELPSPHQGNFGWMHQDFTVQRAIEAAGIKWKQGPKHTLSDIIYSMAQKVKL